MHIYYPELTRELFGYAANLPSDYDVFVTTDTRAKASVIQTIVNDLPDARRSKVEIRVLPSNRGRDMGAFFVGCRDVLRSRDYDVRSEEHTSELQSLMRNSYTVSCLQKKTNKNI